MEIEITTTKKKLSKALVNQMRNARIEVLKGGTALGYMINVKKFCYKTLLIKYDDEFFIIPASYEKGNQEVYRRVGKRSESIRFDTPEECNQWWGFYQARVREAIDQIYI